MTTTSATELEFLINSKIDFFTGENLDSSWQKKLKNIIEEQGTSPCLVFPETQENLQEIMAQGNQNSWTILPCGQGSKMGWGGLGKSISLVISSQKLNQVIEHAVADLTVTVEAGTTLGQLQQILRPTQQFLPLDPAYPETATLGGIIATADSGNWQQRYGGVRDLVLGLSFVRADGELAKAGGKVVKNVAGYDMMKLLTGSYGTLGFISQITLRTFPLPPASETLILMGETNKIATLTQNLISSSLTPTSFDLISGAVLKKLGLGQGIGIILRFQSIPESVKEQGNAVEKQGISLGLKSIRYQNDAEEQLWESLPKMLRYPTSSSGITGKIGLLPNTVISFLELFNTLTHQTGFAAINGSRGLGRIYLDNLENIEIIKKLRSDCEKHRGFLTILDAPIALKKQIEPWGYSGNALEIMKQIKAKFDPNNILSPGRFVGGI